MLGRQLTDLNLFLTARHVIPDPNANYSRKLSIVSKKDLKRSIKQGRETAFKAASRARNVKMFFTNPIGFVRRLGQQSFYNWFDKDSPSDRSSDREDGGTSQRKRRRSNARIRPISQESAKFLDDDKQGKTTSFESFESSSEEIKGKNGIYLLGEYIGERKTGALYFGAKAQQDEEEYFIIKKYDFSNFSIPTEQVSKVTRFDVEEALEYRLLLPCDYTNFDSSPDSEGDSFCLIFNIGNAIENGNFKSLDKFRNKLDPIGVYGFLQNVLQTLDFLHTDNHLLGASMAHGNLALHSAFYGLDGQVYVTELGLWEKFREGRRNKKKEISIDENAKKLSSDKEKKSDLKNLGEMSLALLSLGYQKSIEGSDFGKFIEKLKAEKFDSPRAAFKALKKNFPEERALYQYQEQSVEREEEPDDRSLQEVEERPRKKKYPIALLLIIFLLPLILLFELFTPWKLSTLIGQILPKSEMPRGYRSYRIQGCLPDSARCQISDIDVVGVKEFEYVHTGVWKNRGVDREEELYERLCANPSTSCKPTYTSIFPEPISPDGNEAFRLTALPLSQVPENSHTVGYDAIVVFVSFNTGRRFLLSQLQGKISLEEIRQIFSGEVTSWDELPNTRAMEMPVKLFQLNNPEIAKLFSASLPSSFPLSSTIQSYDRPAKLIEAVASTPGAIGFARLSDIFNQCSVYPLAIVDSSGRVHQPIIKADGNPIDLRTDLCDDKGGYFPALEEFSQKGYPLAYRLSVLYAGEEEEEKTAGATFARMLQTAEGQRALQSVGIVPCYLPGIEERCQP